MATRTSRKASDVDSTDVETVPAPATSDLPSEPNPENDAVPADDVKGPVYPEGATRSQKAAIKRHHIANLRLTKLDARYAKAKADFEAAEAALNEKRPGYAADVAAALVEIDYHATKDAKIAEARSNALAAAQARAQGDNETATALDSQDAPEDVDSDDTPEAHPTNAGHVEFE